MKERLGTASRADVVAETNWQTVELTGYSYYSNKGYRILISLVTDHGYDFVAEKDGEFIRVNVKVAGLKAKTIKNSWSISKGGALTTKSEVDVYLA
ncbi:hypothetical protein LCGC14_0278400 [marine sediment metagenome]|uniref:Uncharacterized protein n=1 Tax=marine sediment metagenome TaxID=412755 RepID=A0A0F9UDQ3_9ZZZZ